jgi:hypothetical protein
MERYIAQKANEALEAMCGRDSLTSRLRKARLCFASVEGDAFLASAPESVRKSITAFMKSSGGRGCHNGAALVQTAISLSLMEFGREEGRRSK